MLLPCWCDPVDRCERTERRGSDIQISHHARRDVRNRILFGVLAGFLLFGRAWRLDRIPRLADSLLDTEGGPTRVPPNKNTPPADRKTPAGNSVVTRTRLATNIRSVFHQVRYHVFPSPEGNERAAEPAYRKPNVSLGRTVASVGPTERKPETEQSAVHKAFDREKERSPISGSLQIGGELPKVTPACARFARELLA